MTQVTHIRLGQGAKSAPCPNLFIVILHTWT